MKSISSQLNRGTELLKQTVQRAIFSSNAGAIPSRAEKSEEPQLATVKPTLYHTNPNRSSSVDSLHLETCYLRPIRPYSLTPFRRGAYLNHPVGIRPEEPELLVKLNPIKVKARFRLQKGNGYSAFCSLGRPTNSPPLVVIPNPKKTVGRGAKRKRSLPHTEKEEESDTVLEPITIELVSSDIEDEEASPPPRQKRKTAPARRGKANNKNNCSTTRSSNKNNKPSIKDTVVVANKQRKTKRKSTEQEKQEKEDFELAKRLQKELNSSAESNESTATRNARSNTSYSLRTTRSLSKFSHTSVSPVRETENSEIRKGGRVVVGRGTAAKKSPPSENGLKKGNNLINKSTSKKIIRGEQKVDEAVVVIKRTTRSTRVNCKSTK